MSKYIIEIDDDLSFDVQFLQAIGAEPNGVVRIRHIEFEELEELNSDYISEHYGSLQDDAYQRGLEDGKAQSERGCEGCRFEETICTACENCCNSHMNHWTAKDDEIKAGDEVIYNGTTKCLVVRPETDERYAVLIDGNGYHHSADHRECKKTGRHFDNIPKILAEMRT